MIPFNPEPIEKLKARYKQAVQSAYSVKAVVLGNEIKPSSQSKHVFDFQNGIRLIISRDHYKGKEMLHISGSFEPSVYKGNLKPSIVESQMHWSFMELAGPVKIGRAHYSKGGIPHWFIEQSILN